MSSRDSAARTARLLGCGWGCAFIGVQAGRQIPSSLFVVEFISKSWRLQRRERKHQVAGSWVISSTRVTEERPGRGLAVTWSGRAPGAGSRGCLQGAPPWPPSRRAQRRRGPAASSQDKCSGVGGVRGNTLPPIVQKRGASSHPRSPHRPGVCECALTFAQG